jgi:hypothetical protein
MARKRAVESVGQALVEPLEQAAIDVQRGADAGVSKSGLQDFRVDSFTDRQSGVGVSQVVDSHRFTTEAATTTAAPRVSFDGENCTYSGPATLEPGTTTLTLENTHETQMDFVQEPSTDANLTMEEVLAWREANIGGGFPLPEPPWMGGWEEIGMVMAGQVIDWPTTLSEGTYLLIAADSLYTNATYPCGVIQVVGS